MRLQFEWDKKKALRNAEKHGLTFDEAITVFRDPLARIFDDEKHSAQEHREIVIGHSIQGRLVVVSFTERVESVVRVISARMATKREREDYEEHQEAQRHRRI
jgi:uncharacterized DUF497 family protein